MFEHSIIIDPDIIPNKKDRLQKEAFELFRRACNLQEAVHSIDYALHWMIKDVKIKQAYNIAFVNLVKDRDRTLDAAIERYQESKEI